MDIDRYDHWFFRTQILRFHTNIPNLWANRYTSTSKSLCSTFGIRESIGFGDTSAKNDLRPTRTGGEPRLARPDPPCCLIQLLTSDTMRPIDALHFNNFTMRLVDTLHLNCFTLRLFDTLHFNFYFVARWSPPQGAPPYHNYRLIYSNYLYTSS